MSWFFIDLDIVQLFLFIPLQFIINAAKSRLEGTIHVSAILYVLFLDSKFVKRAPFNVYVHNLAFKYR